MTGLKFGRLTVVEESGRTDEGILIWRCICDCGNEVSISGKSLRQNNTRSCGCLQKDVARLIGRNNKTHGAKSNKERTRLYIIYINMKQRCLNPKNSAYKNYGGRGISICEDWRESFELFRDWALSNGYDETLTIDRINNDGNYTPVNCRWATSFEQTNNRRTTRKETLNGITKSLSDWFKEYGRSYNLVRRRLFMGWSLLQALESPLYKRID